MLRAVVTFLVKKILPRTATSKSARRVLRLVVRTLVLRLTTSGDLPHPPACAKPSPQTDALFELLQVWREWVGSHVEWYVADLAAARHHCRR